MAGAALVAAFWAFQSLRSLLPDEIAADDKSWVDPWNTLREKSWRAIVENSEFYYYNHIGELPPAPKRRSQWPWQTIGRRAFSEDSAPSEEKRERNVSSLTSSSFVTADEDAEVDEDEDQTQNNSEEHPAHQKEFCIGSIFGVDIGGTLAKLVYFEKKPEDYDLVVNTSQDRQDTMAASARTFLHSRSSSSTSSIPVTSINTMSSTSSTLQSTGETKEPISAPFPTLRRRRSLSLGCMWHFKDLQRQMYEVEAAGLASNVDPSPTPDTPRGGNQNSIRPRDSIPSQIDFDGFKNSQQESVPGDIEREWHREGFHLGAMDQESSHCDYQDSIRDNLPSNPSMRKSSSMFDLCQSKQKAVALDRFYSFARRLDSYENSVRDHQLSFFSRELGGEFHFIHFESRWMHQAMELIRSNDLHLNISKMGATGGGAHKYAAEWEKNLGIQMDKQEELDSLVAGMQFVLSTVVGECHTFRPREGKESAPPSRATSTTSSALDIEETMKDHQVGAPLLDDSLDEFDNIVPPEKTRIPQNSVTCPNPIENVVKDPATETTTDETSGENDAPDHKNEVDEWWWSRKVQRDAISYSKSYPYLLVTIGTGVSILRVDGPRKHERISGSTIGGGTYWGLIRLLTDVEDFEDVMRLAEKGDPAKVDMMVGDIYGENSDALEKLGLPSNVVASSFGKLVSKEDPAAGIEQEDLARALLLMITNNIGQVSYLNAKLHNTRRIYFVGNFLRGNTLSQRRLSYAIDYWSKGEMEALFLEHEGYFGALGAFLMSQKIEQDEGGFVQWGEKQSQSPEFSESQSMSVGGNHRKSASTQSLYKQRRLKTFGA